MYKDIVRIEKTIPEIRNRLLQDEKIRSLLVYDSPDALTQEEIPTIETVKDYISLYPVIEQGIITTDRNTAIVIDLTAIDTGFDTGDTTIMGTIVVSVLCTDQCLLLDKDKLRHLELARIIINDLDDMKCSASGKLEVAGLDRFINKHYYGCAIKVLVTDDATEQEF